MSQGQRLAIVDAARGGRAAGRRARRSLTAAALGALALLALAAPASAVELLPGTTVSTDANRDAACFGRDLTGTAGVASTGADLPELPAADAGEIRAVLHGDTASDWDVAIIDRNTGAEEFQPAEREPWRLTCSTPAGDVLTSQQLFIKRGQVKSVDFSSSCGRRR